MSFVLSFPPSEAQQDFRKLFESLVGSGSEQNAIVIEALAGTGKTTTMKWAAYEFIPRSWSCLFTSFANKIVDAVKEDGGLPPNWEVTGLHKMGFRACKSGLGYRRRPSDNKIQRIIEEIYDFNIWETDGGKIGNYQRQFAKAVEAGVGLLQVNLCPEDISTDDIADIMDYNTIEYGADHDDYDEQSTLIAVRKVFLRAIKKIKAIDFNDMLAMPHYHDLDVEQFDCVVVDECQDLNPAQQNLIKRMKPKMVIAVGDSHQAIMGFQGASPKSVQEITEMFNAKTTSLNVNYRCPRSVIEIAQRSVPEIEAWSGANEGTVATLSGNEAMISRLQVGDAVLCRKNAPLIEVAFGCLERRIPAKIKGENVAKELLKLVDAMKCDKVYELTSAIDAFHQKEVDRLSKRKSKYAETAIELLEQKVSAVHAMIKGTISMGKESVRDLKEFVNGIFVREHDGKGVNLLTAHACKGLEFDTVFIIEADDFKIIRENSKDWQIEQEDNLWYVAVTRSKDSLFFVPKKPKGGDEEVSQSRGSDSPPLNMFLAEARKDPVTVTPEPVAPSDEALRFEAERQKKKEQELTKKFSGQQGNPFLNW